MDGKGERLRQSHFRHADREVHAVRNLARAFMRTLEHFRRRQPAGPVPVHDRCVTRTCETITKPYCSIITGHRRGGRTPAGALDADDPARFPLRNHGARCLRDLDAGMDWSGNPSRYHRRHTTCEPAQTTAGRFPRFQPCRRRQERSKNRYRLPEGSLFRPRSPRLL